MCCPESCTKIDHENEQRTNIGTGFNNDHSQTIEPLPLIQERIGMGWFKILIYFVLFANSVLNAFSGIMYLTGMVYGNRDKAQLVYSFIDSVKVVDVITGILSIAVAIWGIYTRFQLAKYRTNAPKKLTILSAACVIINILYAVGLLCVLPYGTFIRVDFTFLIVNTVVAFAIIFINATYFKKRKHLFVN